MLLGRARHNLGTNILIEGLDPANIENYHGGTVDTDNSGSLKYVRIEYGGFIFSANNEINGLTMGSVGSGTTIDHVQVSFTNDDAFEWFGGTVNAKYLLLTGTWMMILIQTMVLAEQYSMLWLLKTLLFLTFQTLQVLNLIMITQVPVKPATLKQAAKFYNVTQIGAFRCASNAPASGGAGQHHFCTEEVPV